MGSSRGCSIRVSKKRSARWTSTSSRMRSPKGFTAAIRLFCETTDRSNPKRPCRTRGEFTRIFPCDSRCGTRTGRRTACAGSRPTSPNASWPRIANASVSTCWNCWRVASRCQKFSMVSPAASKKNSPSADARFYCSTSRNGTYSPLPRPSCLTFIVRRSMASKSGWESARAARRPSRENG